MRWEMVIPENKSLLHVSLSLIISYSEDQSTGLYAGIMLERRHWISTFRWFIHRHPGSKKPFAPACAIIPLRHFLHSSNLFQCGLKAGNPALSAAKSELALDIQFLLYSRNAKDIFLPEEYANRGDKNMCNTKILTGRSKVQLSWSRHKTWQK